MNAWLALAAGADPAAVLVVDGVLRGAIREANLTRAPAAGFPSAAVDALLDAAGLRPAAVAGGVVTDVAAAPRGVARLADRARALLAPTRAGAEAGARVRAGVPRREALTAAELPGALARSRLPPGGWRVVDPADAGRAIPSAAAWARGPAAGLALGAAFVHLAGLAFPLGPPAWGPDVADLDAYRALSNGDLPRARTESPVAFARAVLATGGTVAWASGPAPFLDEPLGTRVLLRPGGGAVPPGWFGPDLLDAATPAALLGPDGRLALTATDAVRAFRHAGAAALVLGDYALRR